jgi:rod shape-determining protein MreD
MKHVWLLLSIFLAFVIQTKISIFGVPPDITAAVAYYLGLNSGATKGLLFGSFIGLVEDSVGGTILGPNLLGKGMVGFFASFLSGTLFRWTPMLGMVSLVILTVLDGVVVFWTRAVFETAPASFSTGFVTSLMQGLLNAIIGFVIRPKNVD